MAPSAVEAFSQRARGLGFVSDLWIAGSLATGDYRPGVSDIDLVAIVAEELNEEHRRRIGETHRELDEGVGNGVALGCVYVDVRLLGDEGIRHPTWTHGELIERRLSRLTRAELIVHGVPLFGLEPSVLLGNIDDREIRGAARAELRGYWAWAIRRPTLWLAPDFAELSLITMARARHALRTGELITKSEAIERASWPDWLSRKLTLRRRGEDVALPRLRLACRSWPDACRTVLTSSRR
jgi:hypothetical protein